MIHASHPYCEVTVDRGSEVTIVTVTGEMDLFAAPSLLGGVLGAVLLLRTPSETFGRLVPFLILFATLLLAAQEPISRRLRAGREEGHEPTRAWCRRGAVRARLAKW